MNKFFDCGLFTLQFFSKQKNSGKWNVILKITRPEIESTVVLVEVASKKDADAEVLRIISCLQTEHNSASDIDAAAHQLFSFDASKASGRTQIGEHVAFYHENRLYSVRNTESNVLSLVTASNPQRAIETISGVCVESNTVQDPQEYSALELVAYEQYKREWCADRGCMPAAVDTEIGINGGECFACIDEFLDWEFDDMEDYYLRFYTLRRLLEWVQSHFGQDNPNVFQNKLNMSLAEVAVLTGTPAISVLKLWSSSPVETRIKRMDDHLKSTLLFLLSEDGDYSDFFAEFVINLELDMQLIQRYIEIPGVLTETDYNNAQEQLYNRCKRQGAQYKSYLKDAEHLSPIWYKKGVPFACIDYKGCSAYFYVEGDTEVFFDGKRVSEENYPLILNDAYLSAYEKAGRIIFRRRPWVVVKYRDEAKRILDLKTAHKDCLAVIESSITGFFSAIDGYTANR